jgi:UDP-N-acetyl-D-mannosaminuronate dehydrogenase
LEINEIISAANSQPFSNIHTPGISVGGHCIPVYPHFYLHTDPNASIVRAARTQNNEMPNYYLNKIRRITDSLKDLKILIIGLAYRPGVKEIAFSGALKLAEIIKNEGGLVFVEDPLYSNDELRELGFNPISRRDEIDYIIIHTWQNSDLKLSEFSKLRGIVDGRKSTTKGDKFLQSYLI